MSSVSDLSLIHILPVPQPPSTTLSGPATVSIASFMKEAMETVAGPDSVVEGGWGTGKMCIRDRSETLDTSLQNPFHICDRDPVICHRDLLVGGIP